MNNSLLPMLHFKINARVNEKRKIKNNMAVAVIIEKKLKTTAIKITENRTFTNKEVVLFAK